MHEIWAGSGGACVGVGACVCVCEFRSQMFAACVCVSKVTKRRGDNRQFSDLCSHFLLLSLHLFSSYLRLPAVSVRSKYRRSRQSLPRSPTILLCVSRFALLRRRHRHLSLRSGVKLLTPSSSYSNHQRLSAWEETGVDDIYIIFTSNLTREI